MSRPSPELPPFISRTAVVRDALLSATGGRDGATFSDVVDAVESRCATFFIDTGAW